MTDQLLKDAIAVLSKAFKGLDIPPHVVQAATSIVLSLAP